MVEPTLIGMARMWPTAGEMTSGAGGKTESGAGAWRQDLRLSPFLHGSSRTPTSTLSPILQDTTGCKGIQKLLWGKYDPGESDRANA